MHYGRKRKENGKIVQSKPLEVGKTAAAKMNEIEIEVQSTIRASTSWRVLNVWMLPRLVFFLCYLSRPLNMNQLEFELSKKIFSRVQHTFFLHLQFLIIFNSHLMNSRFFFCAPVTAMATVLFYKFNNKCHCHDLMCLACHDFSYLFHLFI